MLDGVTLVYTAPIRQHLFLEGGTSFETIYNPPVVAQVRDPTP